jgi:hypothetical protein
MADEIMSAETDLANFDPRVNAARTRARAVRAAAGA